MYATLLHKIALTDVQGEDLAVSDLRMELKKIIATQPADPSTKNLDNSKREPLTPAQILLKNIDTLNR